jgi:hypothetical protein
LDTGGDGRLGLNGNLSDSSCRNCAEYLPSIPTESDKIQRPHKTGYFEGDAFVDIDVVCYLPASGGNCFFEFGHSGLLSEDSIRRQSLSQMADKRTKRGTA